MVLFSRKQSYDRVGVVQNSLDGTLCVFSPLSQISKVDNHNNGLDNSIFFVFYLEGWKYTIFTYLNCSVH